LDPVLLPNTQAEYPYPADVISTFEDLHLGDYSESTSQKQLDNRNYWNNEPLTLLPVRSSSHRIVRYSLEYFGWVHCALNAPDFLQQHEDFWNALESEDTSVLGNHFWMALYFSLIAVSCHSEIREFTNKQEVGSYFMNDEDIKAIHYLHEGFSGRKGPPFVSKLGDSYSISRLWYDNVFKELNNADFLGKPDLITVQTLAVLSLLHRNFGESQKEYTLLGLAINTARLIGMDRLGVEGSAAQWTSNSPWWSDLRTRESARRLWWTLVICDW
jgi:Centromere DNA-binding protein complex CBF3 subunit B